MTSAKSDVPGTAAFTKFMNVLQAVSDAAQPTSVTELSKALGYPRPTTFRIVAALLSEGMLEENGTEGRLRIGPRVVTLARHALDTSDLRSVAEPHLQVLRDTLDETVHLAVRSGLEMVYIAKLESQRTVRMASRVGTRVTLYSSSVGKSWLAYQPAPQVDELLQDLDLVPLMPATITEPDALRRELRAIADRGYATDIEENEADICCYGCPIINAKGQVIGCLSTSMPSYRFKALPAETAVSALQLCARAIASSVG
jgi:DNA-binding IclR family transcriptional regulator